jgi:hypothetical protein
LLDNVAFSAWLFGAAVFVLTFLDSHFAFAVRLVCSLRWFYAHLDRLRTFCTGYSRSALRLLPALRGLFQFCAIGFVLGSAYV